MRLIDADALLEFIENRYEITWEDDTYEGGIKDACTDIIEKIDNLPTIEPERKTGKWIERNPQNSEICRLIECSECGKGYAVGFNVPYEDWTEAHKYCVECGAKMYGGDANV